MKGRVSSLISYRLSFITSAVEGRGWAVYTRSFCDGTTRVSKEMLMPDLVPPHESTARIFSAAMHGKDGR